MSATWGIIRIEGESIASPGVMDRHRMAMVFQSGALLNSLSVLENVGLYLREHRLKSPAEIDRIATEKLALLGLHNVRDHFRQFHNREIFTDADIEEFVA